MYHFCIFVRVRMAEGFYKTVYYEQRYVKYIFQQRTTKTKNPQGSLEVMGFEASIVLSPQSKAVLEKQSVLQLAKENLPYKDDENDYALYTISHNRTLKGGSLAPFKILFYLSVHNMFISPTLSF